MNRKQGTENQGQQSQQSGASRRNSPSGQRMGLLKPTAVDLTGVATAVAQAITDIGTAEVAVAGLITLSPTDKQRTAKVRVGAEKVILQMITAARLYPEYIGAGVDPQLMADTLQYVSEIDVLRAVIVTFSKTVHDTQYAKLAGLYLESLDIYNALQRAISTDPAIAPLLEGMRAFLAHNPAPATVGNGSTAVSSTPADAGNGTTTVGSAPVNGAAVATTVNGNGASNGSGIASGSVATT